MASSTFSKLGMMGYMILPAASQSMSMMSMGERFHKSPFERTAFEQVSMHCGADVERMCTEAPAVKKEREMKEDDVFVNILSPFLETLLSNTEGEGTFILISEGDEGNNFHQQQENRQVQQQQQLEENPFEEMDRLVASLFYGVPMIATTTIFVTDDVEDESIKTGEQDAVTDVASGDTPNTEGSVATTATALVDHVVEHVAKNTHPDHVEQASQRLMEHGWNVLEDNEYFATPQQEQGEEVAFARRHMARRLTEVASTDNIRSIQRQLLPFTCKESHCLRDAFNHGRVSSACGSAMQQLEHVRGLEEKALHSMVSQDVVKQESYDHDEIKAFAVWCIIVSLLILTVSLARNACCSPVDKNERKFQKVMKLFHAIYTRPHIKSAVEKELGESIGEEPPISKFAMKHFYPVARDDETFHNNFNKFRNKQISVLSFFCLLLLAYLLGSDAARLAFSVIGLYVLVRGCQRCCKCGTSSNCCDDDCCDDGCCDDGCCDDGCCDDGCCDDGCCDNETTNPKKVLLLNDYDEENVKTDYINVRDINDGIYTGAPLQVI